jgi:hypothetical protein
MNVQEIFAAMEDEEGVKVAEEEKCAEEDFAYGRFMGLGFKAELSKLADEAETTIENPQTPDAGHAAADLVAKSVENQVENSADTTDAIGDGKPAATADQAFADKVIENKQKIVDALIAKADPVTTEAI